MRTHFANDSNVLGKSIAEDQAAQRREERRKAHAARLTGAHTTMPIKDMRMVNRFLSIAKDHDARRVKGGVSWYLLLLLGFLSKPLQGRKTRQAFWKGIRGFCLNRGCIRS